MERRAGTDERPLIRLSGLEDPRPVRGQTMLIEDELAAGEWLASDLARCSVAGLGPVARVVDGPSCSLLELENGTLVPLVSDAIEHRPRCPRDSCEPGVPRVNIDVVTLFPQWFDWFKSQRHVTNALALGHELSFVDLRSTTPLKAGQVDDTPTTWRWRRDGHPGRRGRGRSTGALRRRSARAAGAAARRRARPRRPPVRRRACDRARR